MIGLPIVSCAVYLFLFTPNIKDLVLGTGSNYDLSGGFGPNQVSTCLGLGMFIFFSRLIFVSRTKFIFIVNLFVAFYISYRGILTFSRGGMLTGFAMISVLILVIYYHSKNIGKLKLNYFVGFLTLSLISIWLFK